MSSRKWQTLVIEDEPSVRDALINALNESKEFKVIGSTGSVSKGVNLVQEHAADVLFSDIKLIGGTVFDLLTQLKEMDTQIPPVIICTGYREFEYAQKFINDFRDIVISVLKKPFWDEWQLHKNQIVEFIRNKKKSDKEVILQSTNNKNLMRIQINHQIYVINLSEVIKITTAEKGEGKTRIYFKEKVLVCNSTLAQLMPQLPPSFIQIFRNTVVRIDQIYLVDQSDRQVELLNGERCSLGDNYCKNLMKALEEL